MTIPRILACLALLSGPAVGLAQSGSSTGQLEVEQLVNLATEGVGEPVLLALTRHQGVEGPLSADDVLRMSRAGFSDELMAAIVAAAARPDQPSEGPSRDPAGTSGVVYEEKDGAVVARLRGEPDEEKSGNSWSERGDEESWSSRRFQAPQAPQVIVLQAPPAAQPAAPAVADGWEPGWANPYPFGAEHGWTGSTIFLPARFGGSPSAFGRVIVNPPSPNLGHHGPYGPWIAPTVGPPPTLPTEQRTTTIRTSRGLRQVPN